MQEEFATKSALKENGWTDKLIETFLGEPDKLVRNSKFRTAAPIRLYAWKRVNAAMMLPEFADARARAARRQNGAKQAVIAKTARMSAYVANLKVAIPSMGIKQATKHAIESFNQHQNRTTPANVNSDQAFLARITVNFLRHEASCYEDELRSIAGKVGSKVCYRKLKCKILDAIANTYPELKQECIAQKSHFAAIDPCGC